MTSAETIVAISSAVGPAPRMILRLSGDQSFDLASSVSTVPIEPKPGVVHARIRFAQFDYPAEIYCFVSPRSSTGEHVVELHIPGNVVLATRLLADLISAGARQAQPGEFTARAFFAGRIDLSQAEGISATVAAASEAELRAARQLSAGELSRRLRPSLDLLADTLALVEVGIDFSEEDVSFITPDELRRRLDQVDESLDRLVAESRRFEPLTHEPVVALFGWPNAGKSTLLNALCGRERAVVSPVAGTTRDVIWADVPLRRGIVRVVDCAGVEFDIPTDQDQSAIASIRRQMHNRARRAIASADVVVLVHPAHDTAAPPQVARRPDLCLRTKADLGPAAQNPDELLVSAVTGSGMGQFRDALDVLAFGRRGGELLALNQRHLRGIDEARQALSRARLPSAGELIALELRDALDAIGSILGQVTPDDILGKIFSGFCIGK